MNYWVYVAQNPAGRFYVGQTDNLDERLSSHNRKDKFAGKFTRKNGPGLWCGLNRMSRVPPLWHANVKSKTGNLPD